MKPKESFKDSKGKLMSIALNVSAGAMATTKINAPPAGNTSGLSAAAASAAS
jgi:hypothetical protein